MIVIFCSKEDNYTHLIIEWLYYYKVEFIKIDLNDQKIEDIEIDIDKEDFVIKLKTNETIKYSEISFFLYRDGAIQMSNTPDNHKYKKIVSQYLELEQTTIQDYIYEKISKKTLGWINQKHLNKLHQLTIAKSNNLNIPYTKILNNKKSFIQFFKNKRAITKGIQENVGIQDSKTIYSQRVMKITSKDLPNIFFPSLFQEQLNKLFEVRTFYLDGDFYSIALIDNEKNLSIDMRDNYANHIYFRFDLPKEIECNLTNFMKNIGLISGSIDMIYTKDNTFYFIEVNPEGQYEWVSDYGGYNLDKKIASFLKRKNDEFKTKQY